MATNGIIRNPSKSKLTSKLSLRDIYYKPDEKLSPRWQKKSALQTTIASMSSSISLSQVQKKQNSDRGKVKPKIDLWSPPMETYFGSGNLYKNPEKKPNQLRKIRTMTSLRQDDSIDFSSFTPMTSASKIIWKTRRGQIKQVHTQYSVKSISYDFLSSFREIFSELLETFYLQMYLKKKIRYLTEKVWQNIIDKSDLFTQDFDKIDTNSFCNAFKNIFKNEFKINQIEEMALKYFPSCNVIHYQQFQSLMTVQNDFMGSLMESSYIKKCQDLTPTKQVDRFLKTMIECADLQKKLRMICSANQREAFAFVSSISTEKNLALSISKFASFLDKQGTTHSYFGLKVPEAKLINFLDKILSKRKTQLEFKRWLKIDE